MPELQFWSSILPSEAPEYLNPTIQWEDEVEGFGISPCLCLILSQGVLRCGLWIVHLGSKSTSRFL